MNVAIALAPQIWDLVATMTAIAATIAAITIKALVAVNPVPPRRALCLFLRALITKRAFEAPVTVCSIRTITAKADIAFLAVINRFAPVAEILRTERARAEPIIHVLAGAVVVITEIVQASVACGSLYAITFPPCINSRRCR